LITLRNPQGSTSHGPQAKEVTWNDLLGEDPERDAPQIKPTPSSAPPTVESTPLKQDAKPPRPRTAKIVVYYGTRRQEHTIPVPQPTALTAVPQMQQVKVP
ncbi:MAG: hypothetical protein ABGZ17_16995, partial [Planctomycetaceae bacterium]